jgi:hypothetical protein
LYRGFIINTTTTATPAVDTTGLLTNVRLISGSTVFFDLDEVTLQQGGHLVDGVPFAIEKVTGTGLGFYPTPRISSNSKEQAWYFLNLVTDGYLSECINTARFNEFFLEMNLSAGCTVNVISHQFLVNPRSPAVQAAAQQAG